MFALPFLLYYEEPVGFNTHTHNYMNCCLSPVLCSRVFASMKCNGSISLVLTQSVSPTLQRGQILVDAAHIQNMVCVVKCWGANTSQISAVSSWWCGFQKMGNDIDGTCSIQKMAVFLFPFSHKKRRKKLEHRLVCMPCLDDSNSVFAKKIMIYSSSPLFVCALW